MTDASAFRRLLDAFTGAIEREDVDVFTGLFDEAGVYVDAMYGAFCGHDAIARLIQNHFYGNGANYRWKMFDPVQAGEIGYAMYTFSFTSVHPRSRGRRVRMEGVAQFTIKDGRIAQYREYATYPWTLLQLGVDPQTVCRTIRAEGERGGSDAAHPDESIGGANP